MRDLDDEAGALCTKERMSNFTCIRQYASSKVTELLLHGKKKTSKCMQPHRVILRKIIARIAGVLRERINMKVYDSYQQHAF